MSQNINCRTKAKGFEDFTPRVERTSCPFRLLQAVKIHEAQLGRRDVYGQRYIIDFPLEKQGKQTTIRSRWMIEHGLDIPRLTTCYPL